MKNRTKKLIIRISILLIAFGGIFYNLNPGKSTPKYAIIQYCKANNFSYIFIIVKGPKYDDNQYGKEFNVYGVSGGISVFYLREYDKGWVVTSAGTGP